jgi:hypothetical protein
MRKFYHKYRGLVFRDARACGRPRGQPGPHRDVEHVWATETGVRGLGRVYRGFFAFFCKIIIFWKYFQPAGMPSSSLWPGLKVRPRFFYY